jgi:hypothetical protein
VEFGPAGHSFQLAHAWGSASSRASFSCASSGPLSASNCASSCASAKWLAFPRRPAHIQFLKPAPHSPNIDRLMPTAYHNRPHGGCYCAFTTLKTATGYLTSAIDNITVIPFSKRRFTFFEDLLSITPSITCVLVQAQGHGTHNRLGGSRKHCSVC